MRDFCSVQQNGNHWNVTLQGSRNLHSHKIARIIEAPVAIPVDNVVPSGSNNREQNIATRNFGPKTLHKIRPERDAVHVHEDGALEFQRQAVAKTAGRRSAAAT